MDDRNAGFIIICLGLLLLSITFLFHLTTGTGLFSFIESISAIIFLAVTGSGAYLVFKHRIKGRFDDLKKEICELSKDERIIYDLIRKKMPLSKICKKTAFSKKKVKKIVQNMNEKGALRVNSKGKIRII